jgi:hypothetical protein
LIASNLDAAGDDVEEHFEAENVHVHRILEVCVSDTAVDD